ncbi:hypothetical protein CSUB01_12009 [Colletotrichum sublineola]|uniref:Uncharacterized protein n=1 Tax=Colletotrichum sublineola TaxID=1173701 RepID=A0A066Y134_COLSU|nr:hypothetical protein CSUB01_12009 [Colletotrichum sublineola]
MVPNSLNGLPAHDDRPLRYQIQSEETERSKMFLRSKFEHPTRFEPLEKILSTQYTPLKSAPLSQSARRTSWSRECPTHPFRLNPRQQHLSNKISLQPWTSEISAPFWPTSATQDVTLATSA